MFKKFVAITATAAIATLALTGCSDQTSDFEGSWVSGENATIPLTAEITGDTVEVFLTDGTNEMIFWSGDISEIEENGDILSFTSSVDSEELAGAIFASEQNAKTFELDGDILSFDYDVTGIVQEVELIRE